MPRNWLYVWKYVSILVWVLFFFILLSQSYFNPLLLVDLFLFFHKLGVHNLWPWCPHAAMYVPQPYRHSMLAVLSGGSSSKWETVALQWHTSATQSWTEHILYYHLASGWIEVCLLCLPYVLSALHAAYAECVCILRYEQNQTEAWSVRFLTWLEICIFCVLTDSCFFFV